MVVLLLVASAYAGCDLHEVDGAFELVCDVPRPEITVVADRDAVAVSEERFAPLRGQDDSLQHIVAAVESAPFTTSSSEGASR